MTMFDINKLTIREATLDDVDFIATTIIEAEKSGTDKIGPANYFEISETQVKEYYPDDTMVLLEMNL